MSRGRKSATPGTRQERRHHDFVRTGPLRQLFPQLAEVRVEIEFEDGSPRPPSAQSFSYYPAARGFFRYACPCLACNGEFDFSSRIAALADAIKTKRSERVDIPCAGLRARESTEPAACPVRARVRIEAVARKEET